MAEARRRHDWDQTAELLSLLFNGLFRPATPLKASDFHPSAAPAEEPVIEAPITALKVFVPS